MWDIFCHEPECKKAPELVKWVWSLSTKNSMLTSDTKNKHHRKPPAVCLGSKRRRGRLVKMWPEIP